MENMIFKAKQARAKLGIGRTRFYQLLAEGKIRYFKNGRCYLIPESSLDEFIKRQTNQAGKTEQED